MIVIKRFISILLIAIILTLSIQTNYCKAGEVVVEPVVAWTVEAIMTTLFSVVGLEFNKPKDMPVNQWIDTGHTEQVNALFNEFGQYIQTKYNATSAQINALAIEMDGYLTHTIDGAINVSADMYNCLKSFVNDILVHKSDGIFDIPINLTQYDYARICQLNGYEFRSYDAQLYQDLFSGYKNIVTYKAYNVPYDSTTTYDMSVLIGILSYVPNYAYVVEGKKIGFYNKTTFIRQSNYSLDKYLRFDIINGKIERYRLDRANGPIMSDTDIYEMTSISSPSDNVYASVQDLANGVEVEYKINGKYGDISFSIPLDTLRERYGDIGNLGTYVDGQSVTAEGVIINVPGQGIMDRIITGEIGIGQVLPLDFVDTVEGVLIDDAYADEDAEDKPYEQVNPGQFSNYMPVAGLSTLFPFCIPFDLIRAFTILKKEPKAPHWEIPLKSEQFNIDYTFVIDLEQFSDLANIFRIFQVILFIVGLILITRGIIKG